VRLELVAGTQGAQGALELVVNDGDQTPVIYASPGEALDLASGQERAVLLYAKSGPANGRWRLQLRSADGSTWSQDITALIKPPLSSTQELVVSLGSPIGLETAIGTIRRRADSSLVAAAASKAVELPDRWWGYSGISQFAHAAATERDQRVGRARRPADVVHWRAGRNIAGRK
jgi:hypothetical protein